MYMYTKPDNGEEGGWQQQKIVKIDGKYKSSKSVWKTVTEM